MIKEISLADIRQYDRIYTGLVTGVRLVGDVMRHKFTEFHRWGILGVWLNIDSPTTLKMKYLESAPI